MRARRAGTRLGAAFGGRRARLPDPAPLASGSSVERSPASCHALGPGLRCSAPPLLPLCSRGLGQGARESGPQARDASARGGPGFLRRCRAGPSCSAPGAVSLGVAGVGGGLVVTVAKEKLGILSALPVDLQQARTSAHSRRERASGPQGRRVLLGEGWRGRWTGGREWEIWKEEGGALKTLRLPN